MAGKLSEREVPPHPDALPVWVWHTFDPQFPQPDLRRLRPYSPGILLELEVEPQRVLLSDFDLWHAPLNGTFLGTEADDKAFEQECEQRGLGGYNDLWEDEELSEAAVASWDHCLDLDWYAPDWFGEPREGKKIQGVMWEIRPVDLVRYRYYKGWPWRKGTSV